jgi:UDP-N-acetyl-D-glucosamine/UDP-N-acetyl-D-galactosamine dehydrogenase
MACEENIKIGIIGLGYVGLPLALAFAQSKHVIGFDINKDRVRALKNADDWTLEVTQEALLRSKNLIFSYDESDMKDCTCFIITVPTPISCFKVDRINSEDWRYCDL